MNTIIDLCWNGRHLSKINIKPVFHLANLFARTEKKQLDWLATNTDVITNQSQ